MTAKSGLRKLFQYFLQGLIILAPISITIVAVVSLFNWIDRILPNLVHTFFPNLFTADETGTLKTIPGLGFIAVVCISVRLRFRAIFDILALRSGPPA